MQRFILPAIFCALFSFGAVSVSDAVKRGTAAPEAPAYVMLLATLAATFGAAGVTAALESEVRR